MTLGSNRVSLKFLPQLPTPPRHVGLHLAITKSYRAIADEWIFPHRSLTGCKPCTCPTNLELVLLLEEPGDICHQLVHPLDHFAIKRQNRRHSNSLSRSPWNLSLRLGKGGPPARNILPTQFSNPLRRYAISYLINGEVIRLSGDNSLPLSAEVGGQIRKARNTQIQYVNFKLLRCSHEHP